MATSIMLNFVDHDVYRIRGFLHPVDAMAFSEILDYQKTLQIPGSSVEIGVFYGRSLSLLAKDAKENSTKAVGIDLFDISGQQASVEESLNKLDLLNSVTLVADSSFNISTKNIEKIAGKVRFFSVDGGHEMVHIKNDARLAMNSLTEGGVIAFDDFLNPQYPDLTVGIIDFMRENSEKLRAFAITRAKLYVSTVDFADKYLSKFEEIGLWRGMWREQFSFLDSPIIHINQKIVSRAVYQKFAEAGMGSVVRMLSLGTVNKRFAR